MVVTVGREDLDDAVGEVEQGDVEGAATEVEDEDLLVDVLLVEAVGESGGSRLVDDALDVEAGDLAGVLGGLALGVVEVRGDRDDRIGDGLAEVLLGVSLHLGEDHRGDLLGREVLALDLDDGARSGAALDGVGDGLELGANLVVATAHKALDREDGVLRVSDRLVLRGLADDAVAVGAEADDGRGGAVTLGVDDDRGLSALEDGHGRVGGAKVDAKNLTHGAFPFLSAFVRTELTDPLEQLLVAVRL